MAKKDTVYIDIHTSDGGTMQKVAVSAKKLGIALKDVEAANKKTGTGAKNADRNLKGLSQQSANSTKNFSKMAQGMTGTLVPAYAVLAANVFAITAAFTFLKKAADFRVMQESQIAFTGATGVGMKTLTSNIQEASGAMLDFQSAAESASIGIASGLGAGQIEELAAGAGNLSKILGRDVTDSFNRLVRGVTKAEPELLDELGITLRLTDAQTKYAATLGKSVKDLTIYEKKQAVFVEVQGQLENKYNAVAKATDVQANSVAKLGVAFDKIMKVVKSFVSIVAEPVAEFFTKNIGSMTAALALLAVPIVRSIIPGLDSWAEKSRETAQAAKDSYKEASDELEKLSTKQADIKSGKALADTIDKPSAGIQAGFGKDKMNKQQAAALLRNATRTNKKLKHLDDKQLAAYRIHLKAQVRGHYTAMEKIHLQYLNLNRKLDVQTKKMVARWEIAMAVMKGATAKFTKGVDLLFKGMGIIGIALLVKDVGHDLLMYMGFFKENKGLRELIGDMDELKDKTSGVIKEYSKFNSINKTMRDNARNDPNVEFDNLALLGREGKMIESIGGQLLKNLNLKEEELKVQTDIMAGATALSAKQLDLQQKLKGPGMIPGAAGTAGWVGASFDMATQAGQELSTHFAGNAKAAMTELRALEDQQDLFNKNSATWATAANEIKISQAALSAENVIAATTMKNYLDKLPKGQLTTLQSDYLTLVNILAKGDDLLPEQVTEFERLTKALGGVGNEAVGSAQAIAGLNTQYDTVMAGITQFQTKHSELIRQYENEKNKLLELDEVRRKEPDIEAKITGISDALAKLNKLRDLEIKFALNKLKIDLATAKISRGATKYQKAEIQRSNKIAQNLNLIAEKNAEIIEAKARDTTDENRVEQLQLQRDLIIEQNKELERQRDLGAAVMDAMMQGIETNIQKTISDLMKGTETSLKDALLSFASSVVDTMINAFSQNITEKIMNLFKIQTQSQKMKQAVLEGAEEGVDNGALEIEKKIKDGMKAGTADFTKALDDAAKRFAQAIRDACASCTCAGEGMKASAPSLPVAQTIMPKNGYADIDTYDTMYAGDMARQTAPIVLGDDGPARSNGGDLDGSAGHKSTFGEGAFSEGAFSEGAFERGSAWLTEPVPVVLKDAAGMDVVLPNAVDAALGEETGRFNSLRSGDGPTEIPLGGGPGGEDPEAKNTEALKKNTAMTTKTAMGLGLAVTALAGNSKAGKAMQKIMMAWMVFQQGQLVFEKLQWAWDKITKPANTVAEVANTTAVAANTVALSANVIGAKGIYPPLGYAAGGVAKGPRAGYPAILHGNEAVVPLPNGKDIPVTFPKGAGGSGTQNNTVGITVNIDNQGQASTDTESDDQEAEALGERLAFIVQEELVNQKRAGGLLSPYGAS